MAGELEVLPQSSLGMLRFYSGYTGRSHGRILDYLEVYCGRIVDEMVIGSDYVNYHDETIATYSWDEGVDTATFIFLDSGDGRFNKGRANRFRRNQRIYRPWMHLPRFDNNPMDCGNYEYILQEVRTQIESKGLPLTKWNTTKERMSFVQNIV